MTSQAPTAKDTAQQDIQTALDDIRRLMRAELAAAAPIDAPIDTMDPDAPDALYDSAALRQWLAAVRGKQAPMRHPRVALFHGAGGDSLRLARLQKGGDAAAAAVQEINADLQVYDLAAEGRADLAGMVHAMTYGMMAVQPGLDALGVACLDATPVGTTPLTLDALVDSGRADLAALCGCMIAARLARLPVVAAGAGALQLMAMLETAAAGNAAHMLAAQNILPLEDGMDDACAATAALAYLKILAVI